MSINVIRERVTDVSKNNIHEQRHLLDTEKKVLLLLPNASDALRISALGHDIDRSIIDKRIKYEDFSNYEEYKKAHALQSAKIMYHIVIEKTGNSILAERIYDLIKDHERWDPNDYEKETLMTADSLSFFDCNIKDYEDTHTFEDTKKKIHFMYSRMLPTGKFYIKEKMIDIQRKYINVL
jgi:ribosome biogenesis SPOUT family RNA methylase Rps3